jgi:hypothetical protein
MHWRDELREETPSDPSRIVRLRFFFIITLSVEVPVNRARVPSSQPGLRGS